MASIKGEAGMSVTQRLQQTMQYLLEAAGRIFSFRDNDYPATGVQPFEGEPHPKKVHHYEER